MKILVTRLSSLGDVILSTAFLETLPQEITVDWVISSEFEFVLKGHPRIRKLWSFDKKTGIQGWLRLIREVHSQKYDARVDLHRTLRTSIARMLWWILDLTSGQSARSIGISKERLRMLLLLTFKSLIPKSALPTPYWKRFAEVANRITGQARDLMKPNYLPVLQASGLIEEKILGERRLAKGSYFCVMPASRWRTKEWGADSWVELIGRLQSDPATQELKVVLLGREKDEACNQIRELLNARQIPFYSALAEPDFKVTGILIKNAAFFMGCDTGLSHLSEAVGCKTHVIFGPTRPEIGFGPCRESSRAISLPLGCAPCSKDGKHCLRFWSPYECMKALKPERVESRMR